MAFLDCFKFWKAGSASDLRFPALSSNMYQQKRFNIAELVCTHLLAVRAQLFWITEVDYTISMEVETYIGIV